MLKIVLWLLVFFAVLIVTYLAGPRVPEAIFDPTLPEVTQNLSLLEKEIQQSEQSVKGLKKDNEARIVWADSVKKTKTPYSIVYIHGFGASGAEGEPVHRDIAKRYGANLYIARLHDAGINDPNAFDDLTPENFMGGASRALAIGQALGDSVIVIGTSAGGLLSVYLASVHPEIKGLILYSPCLKVATPAMNLITGPWGKEILNGILGEHRKPVDSDPILANYWLQSYNSKGLIVLQQTINAVARPEVYGKIKIPVFLGYYYKNEKEQDQTVSVAAMKEMFPLLGTPVQLKTEKAFPAAGDHVIASWLRSHDVKGVYEATDVFFKEKLKLQPVGTKPTAP